MGNLTTLEQRLLEHSDAPGAADKPVDEASDDLSTDVIGWTLVGSGAAAATGGVALFVMADAEASDAATSDALTPAEYDRRKAKFRTYRIAGGALLAAGALAAGWGTFRLLSTEQTHATASLGVAPSGGVDVALEWKF